MHVHVNTCVCNGGSPVSCLQPCVHPQQSVCGEYDGKVHAHSLPAYSAEARNPYSVTYFGFICVRYLCVCSAGTDSSLCVCSDLCVLVLVVFCQSAWFQEGDFSRMKVCETAALSHHLTISLSNTSFVCV